MHVCGVGVQERVRVWRVCILAYEGKNNLEESQNNKPMNIKAYKSSRAQS